jgi:uncharacterized DUF497 family protein
MAFEWDEAKRAANLAKHGIDFAAAIKAFADPALVIEPDRRRDHGEPRWRAYGRLGGRLLVIAFTVRDGRCRLISARKANRRERRRHGAG